MTKKENLKDFSGCGKMPPQAVDLEEIVLGALLIDKDAILEVGNILKPESFYKKEHQLIYQAIINLSTKHEAIDIMTVANELKKIGSLDEIGGQYYLSALSDKVASSGNIIFHARIVQQTYISRQIISTSNEITSKAYDNSNDVLDVLNFAENSFFEISQGNLKKQATKIDNILSRSIQQIKNAGNGAFSGIPSGFKDLDNITMGWQDSDLVIIAARPSMGKTSLALSMARNIVVDYNMPAAFFSLEMSDLQLGNKLIVAEAEIQYEKIKTGKLNSYEWNALDIGIKKIAEAPLYIDDTPALSLFEFRSKCRKLKNQNDIKIIFVDYLQLMTAETKNNSNRENEVSTISRTLKAIAKELNVPVIALSQLNRSLENRSGEGKRPQLSDLRESGAIEQDADLVIFIHRPEKYGLTTTPEGMSLEGVAEIIIAKHRNGATGEIWLKFISKYAKFDNLTHDFADTTDRNFSEPKSFVNDSFEKREVSPF